ncbi:hypothetical protein AB1Y20_023512 [Prymnesium parvum]|uniref:Uncharacterized protein n=1 Tax=Prymnesium parvum TaxID=97485 RepID=A0AB34JDZ1_PRYPA
MLLALVLAAGLVLGIALYCLLRERQRSAQEYARVQLYETVDRPFRYCGTELFPSTSPDDDSAEWSSPSGTPRESRAHERPAALVETRACGSRAVEGLDVDDVDAVQRQIKAELDA